MRGEKNLVTRYVVYVLCFLSGVAGLTYEVIWLRLLAAVLGNAAYATAAVLAAVMGGMGLGALLVGRVADRREPLRLYGTIEILLGLSALSVPYLVDVAGNFALPMLGSAGSGLGGWIARFVVAGLVVLVPAAMMGATVPVLVRFAELRSRSERDAVGPTTGVIYGLNTAGAALGCAVTGYVLLGTVGVFWTGALAATLDVVVGLVALALAAASVRRGEATARRDEAPPRRAPRLPPKLVLVLALISGLCTLGLESLWTRYLRIVFGHDVHAFSSMLAALLAGLAVGAAIYRALPARLRSSDGLIPTLFALLGTTAVLSIALAGRLYLERGMDVLRLSSDLSITRSHELGLALQAVYAGLCVLAPAMASGALLPALCGAYQASTRSGDPSDLGAGHRVGGVIASNTVGAIVGSLATPLLMVPALGIQRSFTALAALAVGAACLALLPSRLPRPVGRLGSAAAILCLALSTMAVPFELPRQVLAQKIGPRHLTFQLYEEGRTGTVALVRNRINGERQIFVNGVNEVTTRLVHDQSFKLLGHLGLLLHPEPRRVVVICLGGGISGGAAAAHDVETLDVVDLEASVAHAAERFGRLNNRLLHDDRVDLVIDDGRNHLRTADDDFDVIVVDSTHPRAVDSWILYTREFYQVARSSLTDEGYLVQWLPLHGLTVDEFRIIVHTFIDTFPEGSLWVNVGYEQYGLAAYALLLGPRNDDSRIHRDNIAASLTNQRVRRDLDPWGLFTVPEILECYVAGPRALRRWTGHLPINTDDLPYTQFVTPYSAAAPMTSERLLEVREPVDGHLFPAPDGPLVADLRRRYSAQGFLLAGLLERAVEACGPTCEKPPMYVAEVTEGHPYFLGLRGLYDDDPERLLEIAGSLSGLGYPETAVSTLELAVEIERTDPRLWMNLGVARVSEGDLEGAIEAYRTAVSINPGLALARVDLGLALLRRERVEEGITELREAVELEPDLAQAHAALGFALMHATDDVSTAAEHLERALELDPRNVEARVSLGRLYLQTGNDDAAVATFRVARRLYPYNPDVLFNLGVALARTGRRGGAGRALEAALRVNPEDLETRAALRALRGPFSE